MASCNKHHPSCHLLQLCVATWLVFRWLDWTEAVHLQGSVKGRRHALLLPFFFPFSWNADMMAAAGAVILDNEVNLETKAWVAEEQVRRNKPGWTHNPCMTHCTSPGLPTQTYSWWRKRLLLCFRHCYPIFSISHQKSNPNNTLISSVLCTPPKGGHVCVWGGRKKEWFWGSTNTFL